MGIKEMLPVILGVLKDPKVIGTAIVTVLFMEFGKFIAHYRKKPPRSRPLKKKKAPAPAPAAPAPAQEGAEGDAPADAK